MKMCDKNSKFAIVRKFSLNKLKRMKDLKKILLAAMAVIMVAFSASAQFRWGIKLGMDINKMSFEKNTLFDSDNRTGFTGGLMTEFTVPIVGLGFDASLMYTHKTSKLVEASDHSNSTNLNSNYLEIPIHLKYKIGIPAIGSLVSPYIFTGPNFGFLLSKKKFANLIERKNCDVSWNVGAGLQLFSHLQIGASYGFGINKAVGINNAADMIGVSSQLIEAKSNTWTVTAAYLF